MGPTRRFCPADVALQTMAEKQEKVKRSTNSELVIPSYSSYGIIPLYVQKSGLSLNEFRVIYQDPTLNHKLSDHQFIITNDKSKQYYKLLLY